MKFSKISIISIPVKDQEVTKNFYISVLGCSVVEDNPMMPGGRWLRLELPGVQTRIVLANWFQQMPPGSLQGIVLITDDIVSTRKELTERGVEISEIKDQPLWQRSRLL